MTDNQKTSPRSKRNLKTLLIDPFKQIKFGIYVIGISLAFVGVCSFLFAKSFVQQYQHVMDIFQVVNPEMRWELVTNNVFINNAIQVGALLVSFIVILFAVVFWLTHRYYGPLVSIERFVEEIGNGQYHKRCKIREKDELHELVNKLNIMAENIEKHHLASTNKESKPSDQTSPSVSLSRKIAG